MCPFSPSPNTKRGTLSQHFVTHVVPPLHLWPLVIKTVQTSPKKWGGGGGGGAVLQRLIFIAIMACPLFYPMTHYSPFHQHHAHYCIHTVIHTVAGRKLDIPGLLGLDEGFRYYHGCAGQITAIPPHQQPERKPEGRED